MEDFKEIMYQKTTEELKKILEHKNDYQVDAVKAAEYTLSQRDGIDLEIEFDVNYLNQLKPLKDKELLEIFNKKYQSLKYNEFRVLNKELKSRNIEPKAWYYINPIGQVKTGPFTTSEIKALAENGTIVYDCFLWKDGLKYWLEAKAIDGLLEDKKWPKTNSKIKGIETLQKSTFIAIKIIAIFLILYGISNLASSYLMDLDTDTYIFNILNIICGLGLLSLKRWASLITIILSFFLLIYNGGVLISILQNSNEIPESIIFSLLFSVTAYLAIFIVLLIKHSSLKSANNQEVRIGI